MYRHAAERASFRDARKFAPLRSASGPQRGGASPHLRGVRHTATLPGVKKPTAEERQRMCTRKRRYRTQADALDAAAVAGVERRRSAYRCPLCRCWHLTSA